MCEMPRRVLLSADPPFRCEKLSEEEGGNINVSVSPSAGDSGPDVGGSAVLHHQTVLVEVPVHVGHVLRRHQLRHLQSHSQAAVLQDAQVRRSAPAALCSRLFLGTNKTFQYVNWG